MICISDAGAASLHFGTTDDCVTVYAHGHEVIRATKPGYMIQIAKDCINGGLIVMIEGEAAQIVDHAWLLRLAARCCDLAAGMASPSGRGRGGV